MTENTFGCRVKFDDGTGSAQLYSLESLEQKMGGNISRLPFSMKILLEQALRNHDEFQVLEEHVRTLANWDGSKSDKEIPHKPTRVLLQDFTGVPAVVDLASLRSAMAEMGGDPEVIN
ncbi:MAG: aconitate hydratase, partial [Nitrospinaceae bacterium]